MRQATMTIRLRGNEASLVVGNRELYSNELVTLPAGQIASVIKWHMVEQARRSMQARDDEPKE